MEAEEKAVEKSIEEVADTARHYLDKILLAPLAEFGLLLRDKVSFWRFKNQVRVIERSRIFLKDRNVDLKKIGKVLPESIVPLIEAGGDTSDPTLSDLFAGLLASAVDPATAEMAHPAYAKILAQLSPLDAAILKHLSQDRSQLMWTPRSRDDSRRIMNSSILKLAGEMNRPPEVVHLSVLNFSRLGICEETKRPEIVWGIIVRETGTVTYRIGLTRFGISFLRACLYEGPVTAKPK